MAKVTRAAEARAATLREPVGGSVDFRGRLHIDPSLIPPDVEVQWVREETYGQYDEGNVQQNLEERGFRPVSAEEFPALAPPTLPGRERKDGLIRRGGLILMMRPRALGERERAVRKASDEATLRAVNKELERGLDGKNFQASPDSGVSVALDRGVSPGGGGKPQPFADA